MSPTYVPVARPATTGEYPPLPEFGPVWFTGKSIGLPERFSTLRSQQEHALAAILYGDKRFTALSMPTGSGKSVIPIAAALAAGWRVCILTSTKSLQQQYLDDFAAVGLQDCRGRGNFPCSSRGGAFPIFNRDESCEAGGEHECPIAHDERDCPYYRQFHAAQHGQLVVTNYAYFALIQQQAENLSSVRPFDLIVLDEAHHAPEEVCSAASIELGYDIVYGILRSRWPDRRECLGLQDWADWAEPHLRRAVTVHERWTRAKQDAKAGHGTWSTMDQRNLRNLGRAIGVLESIVEIAQKQSGSYVCIPTTSGQSFKVRFTPVWAAPHCQRLIYRHAPRIVLQSANLTGKTMDYLGIDRESCEFIEYPPVFNLDDCPLYYVPGLRFIETRMTAEEWDRVISWIDAILDPRMDRKTIIQPFSYARADKIKESSRFGPWMLVHSPDRIADAVEYYRKSPPPQILNSPSIHTGYDFPGDSCRVNIIPKHPVIDTRQPLEAARDEQDRKYKHYTAAAKFTQAIGRGQRYLGDWCEVWLLDTISVQHVCGFPDLYPRYVRSMIKRVDRLPSPRPL